MDLYERYQEAECKTESERTDEDWSAIYEWSRMVIRMEEGKPAIIERPGRYGPQPFIADSYEELEKYGPQNRTPWVLTAVIIIVFIVVLWWWL